MGLYKWQMADSKFGNAKKLWKNPLANHSIFLIKIVKKYGTINYCVKSSLIKN